MAENLSMKFLLTQQNEKKGESIIILRIIFNRQKAEFSTKIAISPNDWDAFKQRVKKDKRINEELASIEGAVIGIKNKLKYSDKPMSAKIIKDIYTGVSKANRFIVEYYEDILSKKVLMPTSEVSEGTVGNYRATLKHLKNFLTTQKIKDLAIEQIDYKFLTNWDFYLMTQIDIKRGKPIGRNTANKQHQRLKAILSIAIKESILVKQPYLTFPLKFTKTNRDFLTDEEIIKLKESDLGGNYSLQKVRDIYIFSVYTGLRYGDALALKLINIIKRGDGSLWLNFNQEKVDDYAQMLPLLNPAIEIIRKYDNYQDRKVVGFILPQISNQKLNTYLSQIAELVGIEKNLTHHTARHTFATTITLSNGVPIEAVSAMLGHRSIKTTQIYSKMTNNYLKSITDKLNEKLDESTEKNKEN